MRGHALRGRGTRLAVLDVAAFFVVAVLTAQRDLGVAQRTELRAHVEVGTAAAAADGLHQRAGRVVALGHEVAVMRGTDVAAAIVGAGGAAQPAFDRDIVGRARRVMQRQREIVGAAAATHGLHGVGRAVLAGHAKGAA